MAARAGLVGDSVNAILAGYARKHVGIVLGVSWRGETWTFARGQIRVDRSAAPAADTIFEIGGTGTCASDGRFDFVHRTSYARAFGPIPQGMEIDHLCGRRGVRPAHLEAVTHAINAARAAARPAIPRTEGGHA